MPWALQEGGWRFLHPWLAVCVLKRPKNENWVLLILIRETLNKTYPETTLLAILLAEGWECPGFR